MKLATLSSNVVVALILGVCAVASSFVLARSLTRGKSGGDDVIRVIGSARKPIKSDVVIWSCGITRTAPTVAPAYKQLQADTDLVTAYLVEQGIARTDIKPSAISIETLVVKEKTPTDGSESWDSSSNAVSHKVVERTAGYELSRAIEVKSNAVDLVDRVANQSTELLGRGIAFSSNAPRFIYTKLSDLKVSMQSEAAKNARERAGQIAAAAGCRLGPVRFARMNVPQITPLYSQEASDGGVDDTSSMDKLITAIVIVGYGVR